MQHTRASIKRLVPRVGDALMTNLRAPVMTIVEDTSPGQHDTLTAACDPQLYRELGVKKWEEHGSCAENLVFALKEINEKVGLKGRKAIGCAVTVYTVPEPLNLFMNVPWQDDGALEPAAPKGKRGDFVRLRADRDVVMVLSACPQDVLEINGKRPMVAHFVVESASKEDMKKAEEKDAEARRIVEKAMARSEGKIKAPPRKLTRTPSTPKAETPKAETTPSKQQQQQQSPAKPRTPARKLSTQAGAKVPPSPSRKPSSANTPQKAKTADGKAAPPKTPDAKAAAPKTPETKATVPKTPDTKAAASKAPSSPNAAKSSPQAARKKPKKLERRNTPQAGTPQRAS